MAKLLVLAASAYEAQELLLAEPQLPEGVIREARRRLQNFQDLAEHLRG